MYYFKHIKGTLNHVWGGPGEAEALKLLARLADPTAWETETVKEQEWL